MEPNLYAFFHESPDMPVLITDCPPADPDSTNPRIIPGYKEELRDKIIETLYLLFLTRGYDETTLDRTGGAPG